MLLFWREVRRELIHGTRVVVLPLLLLLCVIFGGADAAQALTISGRVTDAAGVGVPGVKIESTGEIKDGILTGPNGNYALTDVAPGTYTITPDKDKTTFSPASRTVTVGSSDVAGVNFRASGDGTGGFVITGRVLDANGVGVPGVTIESTGEVNDGVLTNSNGVYALTGALPGTYVITPDKTDTTFSPATRTVTVTGGDVTGVNFVATIGGAGGFSISGRVTNENGVGVPGVRIESTGEVNDGILTDANGNYTLTGVAAGSYIITPDRDNTSFRPTSRSVSVTTASLTGVNFIAYGGDTVGSYTINGRVTNSAGAGVAGVRIESTGEVNDGILTDVNGNYTLTGVSPGTYYITPDKTATAFTPAFRKVTVVGASVSGVNFTSQAEGAAGTLTISGRVVNANGVGVPGVRIESSGPANDGIVTDANGNYTLTGVGAGSHVVTPDRADTAFRPAYRSLTVTTASVTGVNFVAYGGAPVGSYTISGRVTNAAGAGVAGVRIESTGDVVDGMLTDANGNYTLTRAAPGSYIITPDKDATTFTPVRRTVNVTSANVTGVNFTAAPR